MSGMYRRQYDVLRPSGFRRWPCSMQRDGFYHRMDILSDNLYPELVRWLSCASKRCVGTAVRRSGEAEKRRSGEAEKAGCGG